MTDPRLERAIAALESHYGHRLLGAVLFGSRAGARARVDSDWDVLLVLAHGEPICRSLYREWDERVAPVVDALLPGIAPHFVHLPPPGAEPSSLWLEVAMAHEILSDESGTLATRLGHVRALVEAGRFERLAVHGMPYWRSGG